MNYSRRVVAPFQLFMESTAAQWVALGGLGFYAVFPELCKKSHREMLELIGIIPQRPRIVYAIVDVVEDLHDEKPDDTSARGIVMNLWRELCSDEEKIVKVVRAAIGVTSLLWCTWRMFRPSRSSNENGSPPQPTPSNASDGTSSVLQSLSNEIKTLRGETTALRDKVLNVETALDQDRKLHAEIHSNLALMLAAMPTVLPPEHGATTFEMDRFTRDALLPLSGENATSAERVLEETMGESFGSSSCTPDDQDLQDSLLVEAESGDWQSS
jgi:hypothetical protein